MIHTPESCIHTALYDMLIYCTSRLDINNTSNRRAAKQFYFPIPVMMLKTC